MKEKPQTVKLKKVLHEPVAPYFANMYNTLISIVQGVALGSLFCIISSQKDLNRLIVCKSIITLLVMCTIWHRYVTHTQYIAWRLGIFDTLIPILFAMLQFLLVLAIPISIFYFSVAFTAIFILGFFAYLMQDINIQIPKR